MGGRDSPTSSQVNHRLDTLHLRHGEGFWSSTKRRAGGRVEVVSFVLDARRSHDNPTINKAQET